MSLDINSFKSKGQTYRDVPDRLFKKKFMGFSFGSTFISSCKECQGAILCTQWMAIPWKITKKHSGHKASCACKLKISTKYCCTLCSNIGLTSGINREKITTYASHSPLKGLRWLTGQCTHVLFHHQRQTHLSPQQRSLSEGSLEFPSDKHVICALQGQRHHHQIFLEPIQPSVI